MSAKRCGTCGRTGHNRRTCGKTAPSISPAGKNTKRFPPQEKPGSGVSKKSTVLDQVWEKVAAKQDGVQVPVGGGGENEGLLRGEDLKTWWMLSSSGNTGKEKDYYGDPIWTDSDRDHAISIMRTAAKGTSLTPGEARKFLNVFGTEAKMSFAATHDRVPAVFRVALAKDSSVRVRRLVAQQTTIHPVVLDMLAEDSDDLVVCNVAENPNTTAETINALYLKREEYDTRALRYRAKNLYSTGYFTDIIAKHPKLNSYYLDGELHSLGAMTRCAALSNPSCPPDALAEAWSTVPGRGVRGVDFFEAEKKTIIPAHPNCPEWVLREAMEDEDGLCAMWRNPHLSDELAEEAWARTTPNFLLFINLIRNPAPPRSILERAIHHPDCNPARQARLQEKLDALDA